MADKSPRLMTESEIPRFAEEVIKIGCNICAVGDGLYVIGDAHISDEEYDEVAIKLGRIKEKYGDRDHLKPQIVAYLRSLGRYLDDPDITHWSKNPEQH
ncbi:hypothetical protein [Phyllobacterium ifriqiyense]|uniref:hypothetical protein n=1 Tax=Phyllobacterium ifriqiyense TaxID=314238 RepID=UPI0033990A2F